MASQEAWDTAHYLYGRIMLHVGPPLVAFVVLAKLLIPLPPEELSLVLLSFSFVALIVTIPVVEKRLKMMEEGKQAARRHG